MRGGSQFEVTREGIGTLVPLYQVRAANFLNHLRRMNHEQDEIS
jgi:hypothetical protein